MKAWRRIGLASGELMGIAGLLRKWWYDRAKPADSTN
jgi:hypothetical protein